MTIAVGQKLPESTFLTTTNAHDVSSCAIPKPTSTSTIFNGKKVVLFGVPGAFTPTCHVSHLPGFVQHRDEFTKKGVDTVAVVAVNDVFVMDAWGKAMKAHDSVLFLADGSAEFAKKTGLELDLTAKGLGVRCQRFALIAKDGVVEWIAVGDVDVSGAEAVLKQL